MSDRACQRTTTATALPAIAACNAGVVGTLYVAQSLIVPAGATFGPSPAMSLLQGASLAGYAMGVAAAATVVRDLASLRGLAVHGAALVTGLVAAANALSPAMLVASCFAIGLGCSVTQRLIAFSLAGRSGDERSQAIGTVIAAGLCGIVAARGCVPAAMAAIGWRGTVWMAAALIAVLGTVAVCAVPVQAAGGGDAPSMLSLWRGHRALRGAALQQAAVFAAYNAAWAQFSHWAPTAFAHPALVMGGVALGGAVAAATTGRLCRRRDPAEFAAAGLLAIAIAAAIALAPVPHGREVAMALLDIGTQVALVANQARVQLGAADGPTRGRVAAIVTTIGFAGGAIGASLGNVARFG